MGASGAIHRLLPKLLLLLLFGWAARGKGPVLSLIKRPEVLPAPPASAAESHFDIGFLASSLFPEASMRNCCWRKLRGENSEKGRA